MAKYLARSYSRCNGSVGIIMRVPGRNVPLQAVNGHCLDCGYRMSNSAPQIVTQSSPSEDLLLSYPNGAILLHHPQTVSSKLGCTTIV